jgi:hypothetical protein
MRFSSLTASFISLLSFSLILFDLHFTRSSVHTFDSFLEIMAIDVQNVLLNDSLGFLGITYPVL